MSFHFHLRALPQALPWFALCVVCLAALGPAYLLPSNLWLISLAGLMLGAGYGLWRSWRCLQHWQMLAQQYRRQLRLSLRAQRRQNHSYQQTKQLAQLHQRALQAADSPMFIIEAQAPYRVIFVNPAFERLTGYRAAELLNQACWVWQIEHEDAANACQEMQAAIRAQRAGDGELCHQHRDGSLYWSHLYLSPIADASGMIRHFIGVQLDITQTRRYQSELEFHASRDALTGLANRHLLLDLLGQTLAYATRYQHPVWVVFLNLDRFKFINDTLGHQAGDELLQISAQRLLAAVRETDTVARLGGDEFVLVFPERAPEHLSTKILQRCLDALAQPVQIKGHEFFPTASAGVAVWPEDGSDAETLIKHADIALDRAKHNGRNQFEFFTPGMNQQAMTRLRIEADLRGALERNEFVLHYQPQVDLRSGKVVGMEALIRWQHPLLGMVAPQDFIALAEETGIIIPIGNWVLRSACMQAQSWQERGWGKLRVAVNLSARQFAQADLASHIAQVLAESGLAAQHLEIELTETLVMQDVERAIGILRELKALGVKISVDDFGTGYSSLSYLKRFPIDVLKIDQSFVRDMTQDADDAAITLSIISLAHSLRLQVIAEGVETEAQLSYLRRHHCDQMQGYYFSKPLPAAEFEQILQAVKILPAQQGFGLPERQNLLLVETTSATTSQTHALSTSLQDDSYRLLHAAHVADILPLLAMHQVQVLLWNMPQAEDLPDLYAAHALYPDMRIILLCQHLADAQWREAINRAEIHRCFAPTLPYSRVREAILHGFTCYWQHKAQERRVA